MYMPGLRNLTNGENGLFRLDTCIQWSDWSNEKGNRVMRVPVHRWRFQVHIDIHEVHY